MNFLSKNLWRFWRALGGFFLDKFEFILDEQNFHLAKIQFQFCKDLGNGQSILICAPLNLVVSG